MSGLEAIPIVTGIISAAAATATAVRKWRRDRTNSTGNHNTPMNDSPFFEFCGGVIQHKQKNNPFKSRYEYVHWCSRCKQDIKERNPVADNYTMEKLQTRDANDCTVGTAFLLESHGVQKGMFGCRICDKAVVGYTGLVQHLRGHTYYELKRVVPERELIGTEPVCAVM